MRQGRWTVPGGPPRRTRASGLSAGRPSGPEAVDHKITCGVCGGPLAAREGQFVVKYFLLRKGADVKHGLRGKTVARA
jgi:hypothetical protein